MRDQLLQHIPHLWRAESLTVMPAVSSGFAELDAALGGGWPMPGLLELLSDQPGIGELRLLMALLNHLSMPALKPVVWINPPYQPQAMALLQNGLEPAQHWLTMGLNETDALWTLEQSLRSSAVAVALAWLNKVKSPQVRRLKLAAMAGNCVGVLFRPERDATQVSTATVRLRLQAHEQGLQIHLLKVPGRRPGSVLLKWTP